MSADVVDLALGPRESPGSDPAGATTRRLDGSVPQNKIKHGSWSRCDRRYPTTEIVDGRALTVWHNCGGWACNYCRQNKRWSLANELVEEFKVDAPGIASSRDGVYELWPSTKGKKDYILEKARKENHRAFAMPCDDGGYIVWTTMATPEGECDGSVEWPYLAGEIAKMIDQYLAVYTSNAGTPHLMRRNRALFAARAHLDAMKVEAEQADVTGPEATLKHSDPGEREFYAELDDAVPTREIFYTDSRLDDLLDQYPDLIDAQTESKHVTEWHMPNIADDGLECFIKVTDYLKARKTRVADRNVIKAHDKIRSGVSQQLLRDMKRRAQIRENRRWAKATGWVA